MKQHLHTFLMAYNFAKRLKTLSGLTPYEYICKVWTTEPKRFRVNPVHHTLGLNNYPANLLRAPSALRAIDDPAHNNAFTDLTGY